MVYGDNPLGRLDEDTLDRDRMADALAWVLGGKSTETPLVVGIFGGWGTGKTSLMRRLESRLVDDADDKSLALWFDAWKFARQEQSLWRALILTLIEHLRARVDELIEVEENRVTAKRELAALEDSLYRSITLKEREGYGVRWSNAVPLAADLALRWATAGLSDAVAGAGADAEAAKQGPFARFVTLLKGDDAKEAMQLIETRERERYVAEVTSMEQFRSSFERALGLFDIGAAEGGRRLFVFVDDLDRCLPDDAVAALEAVKLFLDLPGCVFVLGMDRQVVEPGIRARYKPFIEQGAAAFDPGAYLDKIIQIPFTLPPLGKGQLASYLNSLQTRDAEGIVADTRDLIELVVPDNPRSLKRIFNALRLVVVLDGKEGEGRRDRRRCLAKMLLLQICFPPVYRALATGETNLVEFEKVYTGANVDTSRLDGVKDPEKLIALLATKPRFAALAERGRGEIDRLITLSTLVKSDGGGDSGGGDGGGDSGGGGGGGGWN